MTKVIIGILMSILLLPNQALGAEESTKRLKDISKAVSAQLLRLKQKKMSTKPEVPAIKEAADANSSASTNKVSADSQEKNSETKKNSPFPIKEEASKTPPDKSVSQSEKASDSLQKDGKVIKNSLELKPNKPSQTNLQKNDLLRQQIKNIVNVTSE